MVVDPLPVITSLETPEGDTGLEGALVVEGSGVELTGTLDTDTNVEPLSVTVFVISDGVTGTEVIELEDETIVELLSVKADELTGTVDTAVSYTHLDVYKRQAL